MQTLYDRYPVWIYNYLSRTKELFTPLDPPRVSIYVCGPTVYGDPHLGHARSGLSFDVIYRYLKVLGYRPRYVRNITDVGHLEDIEEGEDKLSRQAAIEQREHMEIAHHYTNRYHRYMEKLGIESPSIEPRASGHIPEQIALIQKILDAGYGYESGGGVYFDLAKYASEYEYGKLSGKIVEDLRVAVRDIKKLDSKRNNLDFALWKPLASPDGMGWESPWGRGVPGWHLECTAMSTKYLGEQFDIHGGGLDLQFPHHEAEMAQSMVAFSCMPAKYWIYSNLLNINGQKMSKSLGNFITLEQLFLGEHQLLEYPIAPQLLRFFFLRSHYRSPIDFSEEAVRASSKGLERLMRYMDHVGEIIRKYDQNDAAEAATGDNAGPFSKPLEALYHAMSDDFNTPRAIAALFDLGSILQESKEASMEMLEAARTFSTLYHSVLGLPDSGETAYQKQGSTVENNQFIALLMDLREDARREGNYQLADRIRDAMQDAGVLIQDTADGPVAVEKSGQS